MKTNGNGRFVGGDAYGESPPLTAHPIPGAHTIAENFETGGNGLVIMGNLIGYALSDIDGSQVPAKK